LNGVMQGREKGRGSCLEVCNESLNRNMRALGIRDRVRNYCDIKPRRAHAMTHRKPGDDLVPPVLRHELLRLLRLALGGRRGRLQCINTQILRRLQKGPATQH